MIDLHTKKLLEANATVHKEEKARKRRERNRQSAKDSREKRKRYIESLQQEISTVNSRNLLLQMKCEKLEWENKALVLWCMRQKGEILSITPEQASSPKHEEMYFEKQVCSFPGCYNIAIGSEVCIEHSSPHFLFK